MNPTFFSLVKSEWIKFRSVRSSVMGFLVFAVLTIGLGVLITSAIRSHWDQTDTLRRAVFDPVSTSLAGTLFAQFAVGALGILVITSEYSSGSIRTSLAAVPRRAHLVLAKLTVLLVSVVVVSEIVVVVAFTIGQSIYSGVVPTASLATSGILRAVLFAGLYLTLLSLLGFGIGLLLRSTASSIISYTVLLLVAPLILFALPTSWQNDIGKYLPSNLGGSMMATSTPANSFGWATATLLLFVYVVIVITVGTVVMNRRDA